MQVEFSKHGNNITALCSCPAGQHFMHCKHRVNILSGITKGIVSDNLEEVETVVSWLPGTDVGETLLQYNEANQRYEQAKKDLSGIKKKLARVLMD